MDSPYVPIGERIAIYRRRRGLSQLRLGGLIGRSENWVSKVERADLPVDRISVLVRVADALHVGLADLLRDLRNGDPGRRVIDQDVNALRLALMRIPPAAEAAPRPLDVLSADLDSITRLREQARFADGLAAIPGLLAELHAAADVADDRPRALRLLTHGYGLAARTLNRYGATDAAWVAVDRAALMAEQTGHPVDRVHCAYWMAHVFLGAGQPADAIAVAERGIERARADAGSSDLPAETAGEVRALMGAVHLPLAVSAARQADRGIVWQALGEADSLTRDRDGRPSVPGWVEMWTQYSAHNVRLHRVSTAVDLGDAGDALRLAGEVEVAALRPARHSRHLIDVALAHSYRRRTEGMVGALEAAERVAPEQLHNFPLVREMVYGALKRERGHAYRNLHTLADRIGVT